MPLLNNSIRKFRNGGNSQPVIFYLFIKIERSLFYLVGVSVCLISGIYIFATEEHPDKMDQSLSYMRLRNGKPFPWNDCDDCGLFETDCWAECEAKIKAAKAKKAQA